TNTGHQTRSFARITKPNSNGRRIDRDQHPDALPSDGMGEDHVRRPPHRVVTGRGVHPPLQPDVHTSDLTHTQVERPVVALVDSPHGASRTQEAAWIHGLTFGPLTTRTPLPAKTLPTSARYSKSRSGTTTRRATSASSR